MKKYFLLIMCFLILSCATVEKNKELVSSARFNKNNLDFVPYYFNNSENDFLKMEGDLLRIKYQDSLYLDMICYAGKNALNVHIESNDVNFDRLQISVVSKNNDYLIKDNRPFLNSSNGLRFFRDFYLMEKKEIISLIKNDTIKILLPNKEYQFISALRSKK